LSLRDLYFGINFKTNENELKNADRKVDDLKDNTKKAGSEMKRLDDNSKGAGSTIKKIGLTIGALVGIRELGRGLKYSVTQAAALEEETAKFNTVFGRLSGEAGAWAEDYANTVGRSVNETRRFIAENQNLLVGFGASREEAFAMSTQIQELSVDLASFNNIQDETAATGIRSVLLGQHQAGKQLGLAITEASLSQLALNEGYKTAFRELDPLTKMQLRYKLMVDQSQDSMGDAERTADSYTNQMKRLQGNIADMSAEAGKQMIPVLKDLVTTVNENKDSLVGLMKNGIGVVVAGTKALVAGTEVLYTTVKILSPAIMGLTAAFVAQKAIIGIGGVISAYKTLASLQVVLGTQTKIGTAIQWAYNAALNANPIGLVALAIGGAVTAMKLLYDHTKWFANLWDNTIGKIWDKVKAFIGIAGTDTTLNVNETQTITSSAGSSLQKNASGTNNAKPGASLVGENGPELIFMNGGEKVFNRSKTEHTFDRVSNNSSKNMTNIVNVDIQNNGGKSNVKEDTRYIKREMDNYFKDLATKEGWAMA
jgi:hypothetical protein